MGQFKTNLLLMWILPLSTDTMMDLQIEHIVEKYQDFWKCKVCGKTAKTKSDLKRHTETHIEGVLHT